MENTIESFAVEKKKLVGEKNILKNAQFHKSKTIDPNSTDK